MVTIGANQRVGASGDYEWLSSSVTVAGTDATADLASQAGFSTLFKAVSTARYIKIEATATTYIRLNSTENDKITITATTPFEANLTVNKIYISTGGSASTVTVKLIA